MSRGAQTKAIIVEVKNEWTITDPIVLAKKEAASMLASNSKFKYEILTSKQFSDFYAQLQGLVKRLSSSETGAG